MRLHRHMSEAARFEAQHVPVPGPGCWLWIGAEVKGYGQFSVRGRRVMAHRYALATSLGRDIAPGMLACHKCDTPLCVNPAHLYEGTLLDNARDCVERGRKLRGSALSARLVSRCHGVAHHSNRLSEAQVLAIRASDDSLKQLSRAYGVSATTIAKIKGGRIWKRLNINQEQAA